jgi:hypothetical protein
MTNIEQRLFDFMVKYYGRKQLESESDYQTMLAIYKEIYPYEVIPENCTGCRGELLKKLQFHYETLSANGTFQKR